MTSTSKEKLEVVTEDVMPLANTGHEQEQEAKMFIYMKESGNRLDSLNSIGCYGLGQDCNNVLATECPDWRTNRACQDNFWENYMLKRYGSWSKAKSFWESRVPINDKDVGHWW